MIPSIIILFGLLSLLTAAFYAWRVVRVNPTQGATPEQAERLTEIAQAISDGAMAFLAREYRVVALFMGVFALVVAFLVDWYSMTAFLVGALISVLAGYLGMRIATMGNIRTTSAARNSLRRAFRIAFDSGAVMGFGLVGMAVLGLLAMYYVLGFLLAGQEQEVIMEALAGFGLGGSSIALFARVGGGIFTKAADVGADLVGKLEENIPEDDPRNPAVIADNVGDNVGDVAGMGADLFGSVAESTCAALVIGAVAFHADLGALLFPILITAIGIPIALVSTIFSWANNERQIESALQRTLIISTLIMAGVIYFVTQAVLPATFEIRGVTYTNMGVYWCFFTGLFAGLIIGKVTEYYTSHRYRPVREVARSSETGAATNIIYGMALGHLSALWPILLISVTVFVGYTFAGMYGIAISSLGMLGTIAIALTIDAFGPVADNAGGIAQMAGLDPKVRKRTDALDAAGNTTAAIGKGFAIGSAGLTALALFSAFLVRSGVETLDVLQPKIISFIFVGALTPFIFSAITMKSVGKAALDMIVEVRRQFRTIPGLRDTFVLTEDSFGMLEDAFDIDRGQTTRIKAMVGKFYDTRALLMADFKKAIGPTRIQPSEDLMKKIINLNFKPGKPDYRRCVDISTRASLREMLLPGAQVILTPIVIGYLFGVESVAAVLLGAMASGMVLATSSANSGGAWDNAKKYIEAGFLGGKGSEPHKAAVVGDTVGDPLKDTTGPSLNILIKLMAIISLVFSPFFVNNSLKLLG
ncbi:MAG: V-type H(+)-translocating pyrophosphatase [Deltaproteobacteria bacterium]|nr:V-type H(+)-translocating pyrophosphatase [Deltaproteobacteria bacterium]